MVYKPWGLICSITLYPLLCNLLHILHYITTHCHLAHQDINLLLAHFAFLNSYLKSHLLVASPLACKDTVWLKLPKKFKEAFFLSEPGEVSIFAVRYCGSDTIFSLPICGNSPFLLCLYWPPPASRLYGEMVVQ